MFRRTVNYGMILLGVTTVPYLASSTSKIGKLISNTTPADGKTAATPAVARDPFADGSTWSGAALELRPTGDTTVKPGSTPASSATRDELSAILAARPPEEKSLDVLGPRGVSARATGYATEEKAGTSAGTPAIPVSTDGGDGPSAATLAAVAAIVKDGKEMPPVVDLGEALRFDATSQWILSRWPRVATGSVEGELHGYRVALVSGTREDDVAGALTYYFNKKQQLEKITLRGQSGDPRKLVLLVTSRFGFERRPTNDPAVYLYQTRWNGKSTSELQVRPSKVVHAGSPFSRYVVTLTMINTAAR